MKRTTIYLPDEMKTAVEREAARRGITEAEVIRDAVQDHLNEAVTPMHDLPVFAEGFGVEIATRVDELLEGMADELMDEM
ncbi:MAG: CopG family transcriptional regulator [Acidimicrobiia bacterium]